jgi:hypothetical protein
MIVIAVIVLTLMGLIGSAIGFWLSLRRVQRKRHLAILDRYADRQTELESA